MLSLFKKKPTTKTCRDLTATLNSLKTTYKTYLTEASTSLANLPLNPTTRLHFLEALTHRLTTEFENLHRQLSNALPSLYVDTLLSTSPSPALLKQLYTNNLIPKSSITVTQTPNGFRSFLFSKTKTNPPEPLPLSPERPYLERLNTDLYVTTTPKGYQLVNALGTPILPNLYLKEIKKVLFNGNILSYSDSVSENTTRDFKRIVSIENGKLLIYYFPKDYTAADESLIYRHISINQWSILNPDGTEKIPFFVAGNLPTASSLVTRPQPTPPTSDEGIYTVTRPGTTEYYFVNAKGQPLFPDKFFLEAGAFNFGKARVKDREGWYLIDTTGKDLFNGRRFYEVIHRDGLVFSIDDRGHIISWPNLSTYPSDLPKEIIGIDESFSTSKGFIISTEKDEHHLTTASCKSGYRGAYLTRDGLSDPSKMPRQLVSKPTVKIIDGIAVYRSGIVMVDFYNSLTGQKIFSVNNPTAEIEAYSKDAVIFKLESPTTGSYLKLKVGNKILPHEFRTLILLPDTSPSPTTPTDYHTAVAVGTLVFEDGSLDTHLTVINKDGQTHALPESDIVASTSTHYIIRKSHEDIDVTMYTRFGKSPVDLPLLRPKATIEIKSGIITYETKYKNEVHHTLDLAGNEINF